MTLLLRFLTVAVLLGSGNTPKLTYHSLGALVKQVRKNHPLVKAAKGSLEEFEAELYKAKFSWAPKVKLNAFVTATPQKEGDALHGVTNYDVWGPLVTAEISGVIPIYTFGKLATLKEMAKLGLDVGKAQVTLAGSVVELQLVTAYFTAILSERLVDIIEEGQKYLDRAKAYLTRLRDQDSDEYDESDMLRLRVFQMEVEGRRLEAKRLKEMTLSALEILSGMPRKQLMLPRKLKPLQIEQHESDYYSQLSLLRRPELAGLRAGVLIARQQVKLTKRRFLPDLALGGFFKYGKAWVVEPQGSPFAFDPYNSWFAGAGVTLTFSGDVLSLVGELDKSHATVRKVRSQLKALEQKVLLEVRDAYTTMQLTRKQVGLAKKAYKAARGWVLAKLDLYEAGFAELRDLTDALSEFFKRRVQYEQAVAEYNIAIAKLAAACGVSVLELAILE